MIQNIMGIGLSAICKCGYRGDTILGSGMDPHWKNKMVVPALCSHCKEIVTVEVGLPLNDDRHEIRCPVCNERVLLYDEPSLSRETQSTDEDDLIQWGDFIIPRQGCKCPKCGEMTLAFKEDGILWD